MICTVIDHIQPVPDLHPSHQPRTAHDRAAPVVTELVIFDLDGVLVDSEPISSRVLMAMLAQVGLPMDAATAERRFLGRSRGENLAYIEKELGHAVPQDFE